MWLLWLVGLVLVALSFEAGRRYPFGFLERRPPDSAPGWSQLQPISFPRYEGPSAVVGGRLYVFGGFTGWPDGDATPAVEVYDPSANSWSRRQDMPRPITHRQAAVGGDTVWFAGGFVGKSPGPATDEVWGYEVSTDRWFEVTRLPSPRAAGALVWLNGRLHYFGGFAPDRKTPLGEHLVLDLAEIAGSKGAWRNAAALPEPRGHLAGVALSGFVYAIGGTVRHDPIQSSRNAVHRYDPAADSWTPVASLPTPRSHFEASTFTYRGRIVIAGGWNLSASDQRDVADISSYDPATDQWSTVLRLPHRRLAPMAGVIGDTLIAGLGSTDLVGPHDPRIWMHRLTPGWLRGPRLPTAIGNAGGGVIGGVLFVVGAARPTLALELSTGRWLPPDRYAARPSLNHGSAVEVAGGKLYVLGGRGIAATLVQAFDPARNDWSFAPDLPFPTASSATAVIDGQIYVAGGVVRDTVIASAARLDPTTGRWTLLPDMPRPRGEAGSGTDGVKLYVFGGRGPLHSEGGSDTDDVQVYDPGTNTWSVSRGGPASPAPLPEGRTGLGKAVFANGKFWLFGGGQYLTSARRDRTVLDRVDAYDPVSNTWETGPSLPTARHGTFAFLHDGHVYVVGGGLQSGLSRSTVLEIFRLPVGEQAPTRAAKRPGTDS